MTTDEKAFCESWVRAHAHKWQVLNRAQWNYQFRGKAMVRYVDEVQMRENEVRLLLEYLSSDDCVATLSAYDQSLGSEWKPIKAWYEISNKAVGAVHGVRLYHGLRTDVVDGEDGPYVVEDGCAYKVSLTYYWNETIVPQVPASMSGVSYRIGGISRDPDTGLYTYSIEKRERVQQDISEYLVSRTVYDETKEEVHLGVKQSDVASTGKQAGVANGEIVDRKVSKNADCTSDVHNTTRKERPVSQSSRTARMTLSGLQVHEESRNQIAPLDESSLGVGDSVHYTKTPGGLYNVSKETAPKTGAGLISERCHQDKFTHQHTQVENKGADADDVAEHSFEDGVIVDKAVSVQSNGTKDVTTSTTTPKPWIQRYDWWSGNTHYYVVKYGNQPNEFAGVDVPADASSVHKNDSINVFNLHDGHITWVYGPWSVGDLKFIKHGKRQNFYVTWMKPHDRRRYHRVITVQTVHIRGDAYTDYVNAEMEADRSRSSDGILATKHISTYSDKDGNLLAEWIELHGYTSEEALCTRQCKHGNVDNDDANRKIQALVDSFSGNGESSGNNQIAQAISSLANVMMAQNSFNTGIKYDQNGNAQMGDRTWLANGTDGIREWK